MLTVNIEQRQGDFCLQLAHSFADDRVTAIFGPSGCGKSTLLRAIAGLTQGLKGSVRWRDAVWHSRKCRLNPEKRGLALVFQQAHLFTTMSVENNLRYGMPKRVDENELTIGFAEIVDMLSLQELLQRKPEQLSGGQQQRVAIGRALLSQPQLLLLDEPMNGLDAAAKKQILTDLRRIQTRFRLPMLLVSHHVEEVVQLADDVVIMAEGKMLSSGTLQTQIDSLAGHSEGPLSVLSVTPPDKLTGRFNAADELLAWQLADQQLWLPVNAAIDAAGATAKSRAGRLLVWARDVSIATEYLPNTSLTNQIAARIIDFEPAKHIAETVVVLTVGDEILRALVTNASVKRLNLQLQQQVYASFKAAAMH
ncbi:molybdenum ABC transporter ATP-binding protein [Idiomarina sp. HP20-50]|uniref:molybdenum ABC transporter ATP-binding protein n=1 Tax=Idiomarina sp. HP20-50 TaxID=3070813 RepID=UPI00294B5265|nr:molybdenum ABC transporter ATP-binding protein [Idiomarina sp. HP20-50]MDV6316344.1 molybdenum ABC transporter ATP-binding protein [Idiomarina sp. HP20-50]